MLETPISLVREYVDTDRKITLLLRKIEDEKIGDEDARTKLLEQVKKDVDHAELGQLVTVLGEINKFIAEANNGSN